MVKVPRNSVGVLESTHTHKTQKTAELTQRPAAWTHNNLTQCNDGHTTHGQQHATNGHTTSGHATNGGHITRTQQMDDTKPQRTDGHTTDGHATDRHATDRHATDGHAMDRHATDRHATDGYATDVHAVLARAAASDDNKPVAVQVMLRVGTSKRDRSANL
ncbi:hypothetical protein THAOC_24243 [Thalassiosira oceanica]|uniref:Uncharacterized protein n=1 Tax=Thalassiosira oceanica TaxID=159749 RepID=K0SB33_THAOC|nr:hypothetical protein THAOC_24243 [Thalassiosira oceanica]|eukprot:EJK55957.1 hypothetical protein THAOC_24243 [Thalassiosira oceanica]